MLILNIAINSQEVSIMFRKHLKGMLVVASLLSMMFGVLGTANASIMHLYYSGSFGPTTALGPTGSEVAFGVDTAFTIDATFDSAVNIALIPSGLGFGLYPATAIFSIDGEPDYQSAPGADLSVILASPNPNFFFYYAAGIGDSVGDYALWSAFTSTTLPFNAEAPSPTIFTDYLGNPSGLPFTIPLGDGTTSLVINDVSTLSIPTAELTGSAVPEPSTYILLSIALGAVGFARKRMNKQT
jgi:hypothetical protein